MSTIVAATSPAVTVRRPARRTPHAQRALALKALRVRMALAVPRALAAPRAPAVLAAQVARVAAAHAASIRVVVAARLRQAKDTGGVLMV